MRNYLLSAGAAVALLAVAGPASAVTVTSAFGPIDPGSPGETLLIDFENGDALPDGYTLSGNYGFETGTTINRFAAPSGDTTQYFYVSPEIPDGTATLSTFDLSSLSFYWGSIDAYNSVELQLVDGSTFTFDGTMFEPANGDQGAAATNRRVFFTAGEGEAISGITFRTTGIAFELDDIYGTVITDGGGVTVPEPAAWALMITGFGMVGASLRRRRRMTAVC